VICIKCCIIQYSTRQYTTVQLALLKVVQPNPPIEMAFRSPFTFSVVDDMIVQIRIWGIYRNILNGRYNVAMTSIKNTIFQLNNTPHNVLGKNFSDAIEKKLYGALVNLATRRYCAAHNYIREIHYMMPVY